jgi:hypothetical protein
MMAITTKSSIKVKAACRAARVDFGKQSRASREDCLTVIRLHPLDDKAQ